MLSSLVADDFQCYTIFMSKRAYTSNLHPRWPLKRQEAALEAGVPGWPLDVARYRDELTARQRRRHVTDDLAGRTELFRPTTRQRGEDIYIASLAVLAWSLGDLMGCLTLAQTRGATVHVLDTGLVLAPGAGPEALHRATQDFDAGRRSSIGMLAGQVSAANRVEAARAKAETIRAEWKLPSENYPTTGLLERAGISRNTAKLYLGMRSLRQREHQASMKRRLCT